MYHEIEHLTAQNLFKEKISYHKKCYTDITNRELVERRESRLEKANESADFTVVVNKNIGRPKKVADDTSRTTHKLFDKNICLFSQEKWKDDATKLHNVESKNMGLQYLEIGKMTTNDVIRKRLSLLVLEQAPLKACAYDMKNHLSCLVKGKRECQRNLKKYRRKRRNG